MRLPRHAGLDPASIFLSEPPRVEEGGSRIRSGMTILERGGSGCDSLVMPGLIRHRSSFPSSRGLKRVDPGSGPG